MRRNTITLLSGELVLDMVGVNEEVFVRSPVCWMYIHMYMSEKLISAATNSITKFLFLLTGSLFQIFHRHSAFYFLHDEQQLSFVYKKVVAKNRERNFFMLSSETFS